MSSRHYALDARFSYTLTPDEKSIVKFMDRVVAHLESLGVEDVMVVSDEDAQTFMISQLVGSSEGETIETVVGKGMGALRTAFHVCDGRTDDWPTPREALLGVEIAQVAVANGAAPTKDLAIA